MPHGRRMKSPRNRSAGGPDAAEMARLRSKLAGPPAGPPAEAAAAGGAAAAGPNQFPSSPANNDWRKTIAAEAGVEGPPGERWNDAFVPGAPGEGAGAGPSPSEAIAQHETLYHPETAPPPKPRRRPGRAGRGPRIT
jgi:hypothetical protein